MTTSYSLDLASGLTQVLADSDGNAYLYGLGRLGEEGAAGWQYHHGDALGSDPLGLLVGPLAMLVMLRWPRRRCRKAGKTEPIFKIIRSKVSE